MCTQLHLTLCDAVNDIACQVPLFMGFYRPEYWNGLPFPSAGDLPNPGLESASPALTGRFFITDTPGKSQQCIYLTTGAESGWEEIPYVQGKRNPSKTVGAGRGHQRADRLKAQSQKANQSDHRTTALSNSMKLSHAMWGHPRQMGHDGEFWQHVVHGRMEWQTTPVFLPWEPHEQYEKAKR